MSATTPALAGASRRLVAVDLLRGVAVLAVVLCHAFGSHAAIWRAAHPWLTALLYPISTGHVGVHLFLVISGFCIHLRLAASAAPGSAPGSGPMRLPWRDFWWRRFRRLYPPYVVALLGSLGVLIVTNLWLHNSWRAAAAVAETRSHWADLLTHLLMIHLLFPAFSHAAGNGAFWTLALEEQLYLLYSPLLWLRNRLGAAGALMAVGAACLAWRGACVWGLGAAPANVDAAAAGRIPGLHIWMCQAPARWAEWALGALAAEAWCGRCRLPAWCGRWPAGVALLGAAVAATEWPGGWWINDLLWGAGFFVLLNSALARERSGSAAAPAWRRRGAWALAGVGVFSYSLYLTHIPVLTTAFLLGYNFGFKPGSRGLLVFGAAGTLAALAVAYAFHRLIEVRFMNSGSPRNPMSSSVPFPSPQRPRRLLVISAAFPPMLAGEAGHALHLCSRLAAAGVDVHLLTTDRSGLRRDYPFTVHAPRRRWSWLDARHLAPTFRAVQPDAILLIYAAWNYGYHPMITLAPRVAHRVLPGVRFVTQVECPGGANPSRCGLPTRVLSRLARAWAGGCDYQYGLLLTESDHVVFLADRHREELVAREPGVARRCSVLPPPPLIHVRDNADGRARHEARAQLGLAPAQPLLAYLGLLAPGKGLETLVRAFRRVVDHCPKAHLVLIGGVVSEYLSHHRAYADAVQALGRNLGLERHVTWTGAFDFADDTPSALLWAADVAVLPWDCGVHMNNSSVANVAAHQLPLVTTRPLVPESIFVDGVNVLFAPPRDDAALALALRRVLLDDALRARLRVGAAELHRQWYDWPRVIERTLAAVFGSPATAAAPPLRLAA